MLAVFDSLRLKGKPVKYQLSTVSGIRDQNGSRVDLSVSSLDGQTSIDISCLSIAQIPVSDENIARSCDLRRYPHLKDIELQDCEVTSVSILIGADYSLG